MTNFRLLANHKGRNMVILILGGGGLDAKPTWCKVFTVILIARLGPKGNCRVNFLGHVVSQLELHRCLNFKALITF